jgi:hypothetical protein
MVIFNGTGDFIRRKGKYGNRFAVFFKGNGFSDHKNAFGTILFHDTCSPNQPGKWRSAAIHDGHFMRIDFNQGIIYGKSRKGGGGKFPCWWMGSR